MAAPLRSPSVRLIPPPDIHLTLVPPWNEASITDAVARLGRLARGFQPFPLSFERVCYGPQRKRPRLLWAECAGNAELAALRAALLEAFGQSDDRPFRPHVTLARIHGKAATFAREHPMDLPIALGHLVEAVELFRSPPPYRVLASAPLNATK